MEPLPDIPSLPFLLVIPEAGRRILMRQLALAMVERESDCEYEVDYPMEMEQLNILTFSTLVPYIE